jgi:uncharacterized membrane protein
MVACYLYNSNTDGFTSNLNCAVTFAFGYIGRTQSATIMFVAKILALIFMAVTVYRSSPWKEPIYRNILLTVLLVLNFIVMFFLFFGTSSLAMLRVVPIANNKMGVCLAIMLVTAGINWVFNYLIERQNFHERASSNRVTNDNISEVFEITKTTV